MIDLMISTEFEVGQTVYHRTDPSQHKRLVVSFLVTPSNEDEGIARPVVSYGCALGDDVSFHNGFELSENCDTAIRFMSNDD